MKYILIIVASYAGVSDRAITATTAEFNSKSHCELAAFNIIQDSSMTRLHSFDGKPLFKFTYTCAMK